MSFQSLFLNCNNCNTVTVTVRDRLFPVCGQHDYCRYCRVPCFAGESLEKHADGTFTLREIQGDPISATIQTLCPAICPNASGA